MTKGKIFMIDKADLKKLPRSEQRRFIDLGLVKGETPPAELEVKAAAKK
jgi:hypothetical protein